MSPNHGRSMRFFFSPKVHTGSGAHCAWVPGLFVGQFSCQDRKLHSRRQVVMTSVSGAAVVLRHISYSYIKCRCKGKGKAVPLQAWSGPEGSRKLRFPDFMTTAQDGGKVVSRRVQGS
jgi:hypothetical protein